MLLRWPEDRVTSDMPGVPALGSAPLTGAPWLPRRLSTDSKMPAEVAAVTYGEAPGAARPLAAYRDALRPWAAP